MALLQLPQLCRELPRSRCRIHSIPRTVPPRASLFQPRLTCNSTTAAAMPPPPRELFAQLRIKPQASTFGRTRRMIGVVGGEAGQNRSFEPYLPGGFSAGLCSRCPGVEYCDVRNSDILRVAGNQSKVVLRDRLISLECGPQTAIEVMV